MTQNKSHAVMAQRHEADDSLDDFPTQQWGTRALMKFILVPNFCTDGGVWEPACNRGYMAKPLAEYFGFVYATDVHDYGWSRMNEVADFLFPTTAAPKNFPVSWIVSNPPFRLAEQFIAKALDVAQIGCAMLVRSSFLEGVGRWERLYSKTPPTIVAPFVERLPLVKGRVDRKASTATSYTWLVWGKNRAPQAPIWIPPCRASLERDSDYLLPD